MNRAITVTTTLPEGDLLFESMAGEDGLGRPFRYEVQLLSEKNDIPISKLLGNPMLVEVDLPTGKKRQFSGVVSRAAMVGRVGRFTRYTATMRPWLWLLTQVSDCRIFQDMTAPQIMKLLFLENGFGDYEEQLSGKYRTWEFSVQYRESVFNYVSRLMEQEGIYYYFKHQEGKHVLVLSDSPAAHALVPGYETIPYFSDAVIERKDLDAVEEWSVAFQVRPGAFAATDYDFEKPKSDLRATRAVAPPHPFGDFEVFDYPGEYHTADEGGQQAQVRLEELRTEYELATGAGTIRGVGVGDHFKLTDFPRDDQNREYLIVSAFYNLSVGGYESANADNPAEFRCSFTAIDSKVHYRPRQLTPKPSVDGPQTALVVGDPGNEIWTDKYGRVKLQFLWDRYGLSDDRSSCWVRVAQYWAGTKWGSLHVPRVGQEVIVDFLEGDPDRPIVTGRVYNGDNMPPYLDPQAPSQTATQSGVKSRSSPKGGPNNFNEIRFEDKKGNEELHIQAERDQTTHVKRNQSISVGGDRSVTVTGNLSVSVTGKGESPIHSDHTVTGKHHLGASDCIDIDAPNYIKLTCKDSFILMEPGKITMFAGGKAMIVLDNHVAATSSDNSVVVLDENAFMASNKGGKVLLDAHVKAQSKQESTLVLDPDATLVSKGNVKIGGANVETHGDQKVASNGGGAQVELSVAGAKVSGQTVGVSGASMTEITGALVKIN